MVLSNYGFLWLGWNINEVYTKEVVIKSNHNEIYLRNRMERVEVQLNTHILDISGAVTEHVDVKKTSFEITF